MSSFFRDPTSDISVSGTWSGTTNNRYTLVDDYPSTSTSDELLHGTTAGGILFGFSAFSVPSGRTINAVRINYYDREATNGQNNFGGRIRVGGTEYNASTHNPGTTVTLRTDSWTTNPKTGVAWTVDDVNGVGANAIDAFGFNSTDANPQVSVISAQLEVDYNEIYTITADTRSYSFTGVDAGLSRTRALVAEPTGFGVSGKGGSLVDAFTRPVLAFSLRKINSSYTGACIRVQRSTPDTTQQDIGFGSDGWLDEAALASFVGSGNGTVVTWYDQSGNGWNATNTLNNPRIVNAGVIDKVSERPAIFFSAVSAGGQTPALNVSNATALAGWRAKAFAGIFAVAKANSATFPRTILGIHTNSSTTLRISLGSDGTNEVISGRRLDADSLASSGGQAATTSNKIRSGFIAYEETTATIYDSGILRASNTSFQTAGLTSDTSSTNILIGRFSAASNAWIGYIQEIIAYNTDQRPSRIGIESNINADYQLYSDASTANLTYNRKILADNSSYTLTMNDATFSGGTITVDNSSMFLLF